MITIYEKEKAEDMAEELVEHRLAGCVQIIGPIESFYSWDDDLQQSEEYLCVAKSEGRLYPELERTVKDIHTYENPEIIVVPVIDGSEGYLSWLKDGLR